MRTSATDSANPCQRPRRTPAPSELVRRTLAEAFGTGMLVTVIVGSGIAAQRLTADDAGLSALAANSTATALGLATLILVLGPISGAHLNPAVSITTQLIGQGPTASATTLGCYLLAQLSGGVGGAILANLMFDLSALQLATQQRVTPGHLIGEVVATAGLILIVGTVGRTGPLPLTAAAVAAYIGAAQWFTSSTAFANPAVTIGRTLSDTYTGIAPTSVPAFIVAQLIGAGAGSGLAMLFCPRSVRQQPTTEPT
ncbi:aquaporin [Nocardia zapadnayensis]|uniref:aquaporin n=1 Tax=Nocardia rhamnosiphila TaxID=426716 RepID=UPI0022473648|nr:aquaporin [Nocardia zapadnayensis]MCX0274182.1 aquaporin [Nocardia zapadnayensis]